MNNSMIIACYKNRLFVFATLCFALALTTTVVGQDDPFRDDPLKGNPFGQNTEPEKVATPFSPLAPDQSNFIRRGDPVVEAILSSDPRSPTQLVRAIDTLLNIQRTDLALDFVKKLTDLKLSDEQSYDLYKEAGSAAIFRIQFDAGLGTEGTALAISIVDAADRYATNADRIVTLVDTVITNEDKYQRSLALSDLKVLGDVGAAALVEKLGDRTFENQWSRIRQAVQIFGRSAEGPLVAAWQSNSVKMQVEALYLLGNIQSREAMETLMVPIWSDASTELQKKVANQSFRKLAGRVPDLAEVETRLFESAKEYLMDQIALDQHANDLVKWWRWDAETRSLVSSWMTSRTVARIRGFRRARDLIRLNPTRDDYQTLYWVARLESAKLTGGLQKQLPSVVVHSFVDTIQPAMAMQVLDSALQLKRIPAAIAACEVLGAIGHRQFLNSTNGTPSPLVRALDSGSVRLMSAACEAIHSIDPNTAFAGSSTYLSALVYLSRSVGSRTAVVGHVDREQSQSLAVLSGRSGFSAFAANSSRELFEYAKNDPDLQLIIVTDALRQPGFSELVQTLRSSPRTRRIPILLMVDGRNMDRALRLADRYTNILASPILVSELTMARQIDNLNQGRTYQNATATERTNSAVMALDHLEHYASRSTQYPFFDFVKHEQHLLVSLGSPASAANTCRLLGQLGTQQAQINLLNTASNLQLPASLRRIAANSFATAVKQRGIMLSRDQILEQYERYNASENQPAETQEILGHLLDALEKRVK